MVPSDNEILARVQRGERDLYVHLFDRYYARVEGYARKRLCNAEAARDIASETFLRAYKHVDRFRLDEGISYFGYLLLICRRLVLTEQSRQHTVQTQSLDADPMVAERLVDSDPLPVHHILDEERKVMLREALDRLSTEDREIIHLAFERDLSRRDMVTVLDKPSISAVTSHLYRAMQKLKSIVADQGYFVPDREKSRE